MPFTTLYVNKNKILNSTHCSTGNQWSAINTGDMWSCFLDNVTSLAAEFNKYCRRWILFLGRPYKSTLQLSNFTKACTKVLVVSLLRNCLILEIDLIEWKADLYICSVYLSKLRMESKITPKFLTWSVGLRLALATCRQHRERAGRSLAWKTRIFVLLSFNGKLLCSIQALTLLMQASSLSLVSSRSQASEVLNAQYVCDVVSILMEGDALCPQAARCTLCTVVVQAGNPEEPRKSIDDWLIVHYEWIQTVFFRLGTI